ncbi:MAG: hypothetical protein MMC33_006868 [Icmadophila ericetorum]|nr:hypothetical protein [Icmadophila ericetorum]
MPCFKGLAVSIHTPDGPLPEYSIQKQTRASRITSYIPVPPPKIPHDSISNKPEQSTFAISITLLTPGLSVPYSTPKPTPDNPFPRPQIVSGLPGMTSERNKYSNSPAPYVPWTPSPNETIAAYIYFDGRQKEEVATLLRRGEETWVNSRWVGIPESEGGGLAEREFLFREVGLERWLNGLDLEGKDAAAQIEKRRQKMERKRRRRKEAKGSDDDIEPVQWAKSERFDKGVLRYGADERSPLEKLSDEDEMFSTDTESDDDPIPEATGQIKVALFRVIASGEIKKGEYSPQFDAHDDDEDSQGGENGIKANGSGAEADIDHTTSFAKPKSLDPKSISTQTVTGIDGPEKPYAVFTFLYRGEKQLQKMGILKPSRSTDKLGASSAKRRSIQADIANLKPLKPGGALGFSAFRDTDARSEVKASRKVSVTSNAMDSDDDEEIDTEPKIPETDTEEFKSTMLSPEDAKQQGELAEGVKKIKLKRQHSFEPPTASSPAPGDRKSPQAKSPITSTFNTPKAGNHDITHSPPTLLTNAKYDPLVDSNNRFSDEAIFGSPLKKRRSSLQGLDKEIQGRRSVGLGVGWGSIDDLDESESSETAVNGKKPESRTGTLGPSLLETDDLLTQKDNAMDEEDL